MSRILVVEDEALIAAMVEQWLIEAGCTAIGPARSVAAAMALLEDQTIDAAILDITLGQETSFPIADKLTTMGVPFAFSTGHTDSALLPRFRGSLTLSKPFDFDALGRVVAELATRSGSA